MPGTKADVSSDSELVERAITGDEEAFADLYQRYAPVLFRRLRRVLGEVPDTEDVVQTTFIEAYRSLRRFRTGASFDAWLHGIAFNLAASQLRTRRRVSRGQSAARLAASGAPVMSSEEEIANRQLLLRVHQAMEELPPKKRIAFALHDLEGLDLAEIGRLVGASRQTIWARVESARKWLQERLGPQDRGEGEQP